jgi:hypothetical protein
MEVKKYEIDMLDVKVADAFLIHFFDENNAEYVVLIDGGNYSDGTKIASFIREHYSQNYINLAICTHCDDDHFGGIHYLLEQQKSGGKDNMNIGEIWVNDPADHVELGKIKWYRNEDNMEVEARSVYDCGNSNMMSLLDELVKEDKIKWFEPFSDAIQHWNTNKEYVNSGWGGLFEILGPTVSFYEELAPDFRNDLQKMDYNTDEDEENNNEEVVFIDKKYKWKKLDDAKDDPSAHNQSSVIVRFTPFDGNQFVFMGDAGKRAIDNMPTEIKQSLSGTYLLKVPHHGSIHNMDSDMINLTMPKIAFISTEKYGHYLSKDVVKALKKIGARVYSTNINGSMCHHQNTPTHKGYSTANPL